MRPASVFLMALFLASAVRGTDLTAVVSQVEGNVTVKEEASRQRNLDSGSSIRQARFLQIVRAGDGIHVPVGAGAGLVCSNNRWVALPPGMESHLNPDLCLKGELLPPGTYQKLAPVGGRFQSIEGALVPERGTRMENFGAPTLLSPRNTSLLEARPEIVWTSVQGAIEYEIDLGSFRIHLDASKILCDRNGDDWGEEKVCSIPWPTSVPDLPRGETFSLSVGARHGLASPLRKEEKASRIQRLTEQRAAEVRSSLEKLRDLPLEREAHRLLEADVYTRAGVLSEAIRSYRKVLAKAPESRITLGDTYLAIGLLSRADRSYREALADNPEPAAQAAAEFGLGRVEYNRESFDRALEHFRKARELYEGQKLVEESAVAGSAVEEAEKRRRRDGGF